MDPDCRQRRKFALSRDSIVASQCRPIVWRCCVVAVAVALMTLAALRPLSAADSMGSSPHPSPRPHRSGAAPQEAPAPSELVVVGAAGSFMNRAAFAISSGAETRKSSLRSQSQLQPQSQSQLESKRKDGDGKILSSWLSLGRKLAAESSENGKGARGTLRDRRVREQSQRLRVSDLASWRRRQMASRCGGGGKHDDDEDDKSQDYKVHVNESAVAEVAARVSTEDKSRVSPGATVAARELQSGTAVARNRKPRSSATLETPTARTAVPTLDQATVAELIELLAELYAHVKVAEAKLVAESDSSSSSPPTTLGNSITSNKDTIKNKYNQQESDERMTSSGADQETLNKWLRQRQEKFQTLKNFTVEVIAEHPNRSINVCFDGPKILVLPDATDWLYCFTRDQWIEKLWADLRLSSFHYPIIVLNILIFLIGTTGNIFVCLSVYRNHQLRSVTNYFIVNLAFADFLVILICLPATGVWDLSLTWFFGTIPCKLIMFLQDVSISVSVLTLTAISLDRYYAICHPLKFKSNLNQAKRTIVMIWCISLVIMSPDLIYLSAKRSEELSEAGLDTVLYSDCNYNWSESSSKIFQFVKTVLLYLIPCMLMILAHSTIMRTLRAASNVCHDELRLMEQHGQIAALEAADGGNGKQQHLHLQQQRQRQRQIASGDLNLNGDVGGAAPSGSKSEPPGTGRSANHRRRAASDILLEINLRASRSRKKLSRRASSSAARRLSALRENIAGIDSVFSAAQTSPRDSKHSNPHNQQQQQHQRQIRFSETEAASNSLEQIACGARSPQSARQSPGGERRASNLIGIDEFFQLDSRAGSVSSSTKLKMTMHNRSRLESREKAAKMLIAIAVIFAICYLPVHLINFLRQFMDTIPQTDVTSTISMLAHCVCYLNSAINPIIYNHMNSIFRAEFKRFLSCLCWRKRPTAAATLATGASMTMQQQQLTNKPNTNNSNNRGFAAASSINIRQQSQLTNETDCPVNIESVQVAHPKQQQQLIKVEAKCRMSSANGSSTTEKFSKQQATDLENSCLTTVIEFAV